MTRALLAGLLLTLAGAGWQTHRLAIERTAHAETRSAMATATANHERAARQASDSYRALEAQWRHDAEEIAADAQNKINKADAARAAADGAAGRLRVQYAAASRRCPAAPAPGVAAGGPPAGAPGDLLADVLGRIDAAAGAIAAHADRARVAGLACERAAAIGETVER